MENAGKITYRNKQYTYDEFMAGPGGKMSTDEAYAAFDKASGATKTRRALQRAMTSLGYKLVSVDADGVFFKGDKDSQRFATFGEVERFLLSKGAIKDEKAEAAKKAADKKARDKARAQAKKEADAKKAAARKQADREKAAAKKAAQKQKAAEKKVAAKKREAEKKIAAKTKAAEVKKTPGRKPAAKTAAKPGRPAKAAAAVRKPGRPRKAAAETGAKTVAKKSVKAPVKRARRVSVPVSENLKNSGLVIKVGRKEYTQERLKGLALDSYRYDMGGDPKGAKVELYVQADAKKCLFIVNGREKGEFDL